MQTVTASRHGVRLHFRFTLSFRDVEKLPAERRIEVSYETIRCGTIKFGPLIAANLRRDRSPPTGSAPWLAQAEGRRQ
jgi:transposase-like protein